MATRIIGNALVRLDWRWSDGGYFGTVQVGRTVWRFERLTIPACGFGPGITVESPEAYDRMAQKAVDMGSLYTSALRAACPEGNVSPWFPSAEVSDLIAEAVASALAPNGRYVVTRGLPGSRA